MKRYINISITGLEISNEKIFKSCQAVFEDLLTDYCLKHFGSVRGKIKVENCNNVISFEDGLQHILDEGYDVFYDKGEESESNICFSCPCCDEYVYKIDYPVLFTVKEDKEINKFYCPICHEIL